MNNLKDFKKVIPIEIKEDTAKIPLYLTIEQAKKLLSMAIFKIKSCAWVMSHIEEYPEDKRDQTYKNAEDSLKFWQDIETKLSSQMKYQQIG